jgi:glycosyltransferase involved in cell wall biosynthesis
VRLHYLANASSVHVQRWLHLARSVRLPLEGTTVHDLPEGPLHGSWTQLGTTGGALGYLWAGVRFRRLSPPNVVVHAHNASGYGLMALVSGRPYIVTVYGTEVYDAQRRGRLYFRVLATVLRRAVLVTCTTPAMEQHLRSVYDIDERRIRMFSMGISLAEFTAVQGRNDSVRRNLGIEPDALVITSNRRIRTHYRTQLLLQAFAIVRGKEARARLVLLEGDSDPAYVASVRGEVARLRMEDSVAIVPGFRTQSEIRSYLVASDLVVSIPISDQMSASILEALACNASLGLSKLPAYQELFQNGLAVPLNTDDPSRLAEDLLELLRSLPVSGEQRWRAASWLEEFHSDSSAVRHLQGLYKDAGVRSPSR